jgi:hypothetical protein
MAVHQLEENFKSFFVRINPSATFEQKASSEHNSIRGLIEDSKGKAAIFKPKSFLQGSYKQDTAIYSINDVDIVVLCELWQPYGGSGNTFNRNDIFNILAAPLIDDSRYNNKIYYNDSSMCIKVDLGIKIEILPAVYAKDNHDFNKEPFRLYIPELHSWRDGYARYHQEKLTGKNDYKRTCNNFKPAIKVLKHLKSKYNIDAASFHIECLLYAIADKIYFGKPADYITNILECISGYKCEDLYKIEIKTPCGERNIFCEQEWNYDKFKVFHAAIQGLARMTRIACDENNKEKAVMFWKTILGEDYFPKL